MIYDSDETGKLHIWVEKPIHHWQLAAARIFDLRRTPLPLYSENLRLRRQVLKVRRTRVTTQLAARLPTSG